MESLGDVAPVPGVVERQRQRFSYSRILQLFPAFVDDDAPHQSHVVLEVVPAHHDPALVAGGDVVAVEPVSRIGFPSIVDQSLAERFAHHRSVAVIVVAYVVEIVATPIDAEVPAPVIGNALVQEIA